MKTAFFLLSFTAIVFAADSKPDLKADPNVETIKKLGAVTWDLQSHKLTWTVQKGSNVNGEFVPQSEEHYSITPDDAVMSLADEQRGFSEDEATTLHHLLDVLSIYCAESVVWWDQGQGTPVTDARPGNRSKGEADRMAPPEKKARPEKTEPEKTEPARKPVKVGEPAQKKNGYHVADTDMVAMNRIY